MTTTTTCSACNYYVCYDYVTTKKRTTILTRRTRRSSSHTSKANFDDNDNDIDSSISSTNTFSSSSSSSSLNKSNSKSSLSSSSSSSNDNRNKEEYNEKLKEQRRQRQQQMRQSRAPQRQLKNDSNNNNNSQSQQSQQQQYIPLNAMMNAYDGFKLCDTKCFIVGAGVGSSIDNLTLRAANILKSADYVFYDDLGASSETILDFCGERCTKTYVGKRGGDLKSKKQSEINAMLVEVCSSGKYKHVVRLKGGDPAIFGRLGNEIEALKRAKVKYEIVPGVSSLQASAAAVGVPLTETMRGGRHFACISGHDAKTNPESFRDLANVDTVVVFMGGKNIADVVDALLLKQTFSDNAKASMTANATTINAKRSKNTPCAVVRDVDGEKEKRWLGTLGDIVEKTKGDSLSPCILIVGEVVRSATLHERRKFL